MALIRRFQQYSQVENTITNNVLLMLSNLYEINPIFYEEYIQGLIEDSTTYEAVPLFRQQIGNRGNGVIDGFIQVKASKIIIEAKQRGLERIDKLIKYTDSFDYHEYKLLIHLSSEKYTVQDVNDIKARLALMKEKSNIDFLALTYQEMVDQLIALRVAFSLDHQVHKLSEDFENYCREMRLLESGKNVLRAMACGQSFKLNVKHRLYFDLASRGFSDFEFLGIYRSKAVHYIGRVENEIVADWNSKSGLTVHSSKNSVTQEQEHRLSEAIQDALNEGWSISNDHRFFLMSDFAATDFRKSSPGGIFRVRYLKLEDHFVKVPTDIVEIASGLNTQKWS